MKILLWTLIFVVTTAIFAFYMFHVRYQENAEWYDDYREIPNLWVLPYCTPVFSVGALQIIYDELGAPGGAFVAEPLRILGIITVFMIPIGILGGVGVPLPWPLAPRWVVERRKKDRAARKRTTSGA